ncbi:MAG: hypothetical protein V5A88_07340 [Candidatus Thermoplasmatota archaeon]
MASSQQTSSSGDYIILRTQVPPMGIEDEMFRIKTRALVYRNGKPVGEDVTIHVKIEGVNLEYTYETSYQAKSGRIQEQPLTPLREGQYRIQVYASSGALESRVSEEDFGVSKPPVPYDIRFSQDGSTVHFTSQKLNETGHPDPDYPFKLRIINHQYGQGETVVKVLRNVTEKTVKIKEEWQRGIIYVEVIDKWGWQNSEQIDLDNYQFGGYPISYDYDIERREPRLTWIIERVILSAVLIIIFYVVAAKVEGGKTKESDRRE